VKKDITVAADVRNTRGKNEANRTRSAGKIPAVVYGAGQDPVAVAVDPRDILKIVHSNTGYNTILNLAIAGGETANVMVVDHQNDPIKNTLLHADLKRIDMSKRLKVTVPVITRGEPRGVKQQGGHFEVVTRTVDLDVLPDEIPESFVLDVTEMLIGQSRRAGDLPFTGSMKLVSAPDAVLAHVIALRGEAAAAEGEAAPAAEPEVVKKGKKEEEGGEEKKKK
jgi:large subunit ribosomal protein L25